MRKLDKGHVEATLNTYADIYHKSLEQIAVKVLNEVVAPFCDCNRLTFVSKGGAYYFYLLDDGDDGAPLEVWNQDGGFHRPESPTEIRGSRRVRAILDLTNIYGHPIGASMPNYTPRS